MIDDSHLLRQYCNDGSEAAFGELVKRHLGFVYFSALRQVNGDKHLAEDVAQEVFATLVLKAQALSSHPTLAGWLYTTTRHKAAHAIDAERRRKAREQKAQMTEDFPESSELSAEWERVGPLIDDVLHNLNPKDREVVLLRFFHGSLFPEIGARLGLTADAARFRLDRVLKKMRVGLAKRGVSSTSTALALVLADQARAVAPAELATTVLKTALASAGAAAAGPFGIFEIMSTTKITISLAGILAIAAILGIPTAGISIYELRANKHVQTELAAANNEFETQTARFRDLEEKIQSAEQTKSELLTEANALKASAASANKRNLYQAAAGVKSDAQADAGAKAWDPVLEGQKFLDAFPQARALLMQAAVPIQASNPFFHIANLTPAQIDQFENLMASTWVDNLGVKPNEVDTETGSPTADRLSRVFGDQIAQEYQAYQQTLLYPYKFTENMAIAASEAGTPLSIEQNDQLAQIIANNAGPYQIIPGSLVAGNYNAAANAVDWNAAIAQAKAILPPAQFSAVQGPLLALQFNAAVAQAQQKQAQTNP